MPSHRSCLIIALLSVLCLPGNTALYAQAEPQSVQNTLANDSNNANQQRPKIGLVLSGGGARGFAHIGVLKVLEHNRIPIDYIVGTSMGSIIGGSYAIGLTPGEIEHNVQDVNWDKVFSDHSTREYTSFRRKHQAFDFFNIRRVGITGDGLEISSGLIEGQTIELVLDRLAYPGFHINDYDNFAIPFRAVATNLENGEPFVIDHGNLARAMRASMSIPGLLPPITIDNTLLIDGGIGNNIPIDVARSLGADIIIVIDVSAPLEDKANIQSALDITEQLSNILTRRNADQQLKSLTPNDLLIRPELKAFSSSDFSLHNELIAIGMTAANQHLKQLQKYSLSKENYANYRNALPSVVKKTPIINYVDINNESPLSKRTLSRLIRQKTGEVLDISQLEEDLSIIYGLDQTSTVVYSLDTTEKQTGLIIYVRNRTWAQHYLEFGLQLGSETEVGSSSNIDIVYNHVSINSLGAEFRGAVGLGNEPSATAEFYQPLSIDLDYFVAAEVGVTTELFPILNNERNHIESFHRFERQYIQLSVGKTFAQNTELRLDLFHTDGNTQAITGNSPISNFSFTEAGYNLGLLHDSLDNISFPNTGLFGNINFINNTEALGASSDYQQIKFSFGGAGTYKRYTVFSRILLETTLDGNAPDNAIFRHGGFLELSGNFEDQLVGQHFGLVEAVFYRRLGNISFLPMYAGFSVETGNAWDNYNDINLHNSNFSGSVFIGADTFLGPVYLAFGLSENGEQALYFTLGKSFLR